MVHAELHLHQGRGRREGIVGRGGGNDDEVDVVGRHTRICQSFARGGHGKVRGELAFGRDMALLDADALLDPFVGRVDGARQFLIGDDSCRQVAADTADDGTQSGHADVASVWLGGSGGAACMGKRCMVSPILSMRRLRAIS